MLRVGLTGGIGSGKSTACKIFIELGVPVIDSDAIARDLVQPGTQTIKQITVLFGDEVLQQDGHLNRGLIRELVFNDKGKREQLESLLHPLIRQQMQQRIETLNTPYVILAIPLLLEKHWQHQLDRVLVVDCSEEQQLDRAGKRDGGSPQIIARIIASQISRAERLAAADDVLDNSGSDEALRKQIEALHQRYLCISQNK